MDYETLKRMIAECVARSGTWTGLLDPDAVEQLECDGFSVHVLPARDQTRNISNAGLRRCAVSCDKKI